MKTISKILSASLLCGTLLNASGYRIPEQSANAVALSSANIASVKDADASYYNPANMSFMEEGNFFQGNLNYIYLPKVNFKNSSLVPGTSDGKSEKEHFFVPTVFYVSPEVYDNIRFGLSITAPGGLSKRWNAPYMKTFAEEFTLKIVEVNPSMSYKVNDKLALGLGLRLVHTSGKIKSNGLAPIPGVPAGNYVKLSRDMTGDSFDFGYNLALAYRPTDDLALALTYRSKVNLTVKGDADIISKSTNPALSPLVDDTYSGNANVTVPLPATFDFAIAKTFDKTTVEFVYEREFWSSYKELDFDYSRSLKGGAKKAFDDSKAKDWKDVNIFRLGLTHDYSEKLRLMGGFAYSKEPSPESTTGFELPDADALIYSAGFEYKINKKMQFGLAYLYADKKNRKIKNDLVNGEFKDNAAHLASMSFQYKF
ncbi:MAG: transporter [Arcobacter sp.]|nr:transporter [Arcobacter sp.]